MTTDAINDEILRIKRELASRFDNDLDRIIEDLRTRERNTFTRPPQGCMPGACDGPQPRTQSAFDGTNPVATG